MVKVKPDNPKDKKLEYLTLRQAVYVAKKEFPTLRKSTDGYNYKYTDLAALMEGLKPTLDKYELDIMHSPIGKMGTDKSFVGMKTIVTFMPTGEEDCCEFAHLVDSDKAQDMGSYQTYYRRYNLLCYFNLIPEKQLDDDGERMQQRVASNNARVRRV